MVESPGRSKQLTRESSKEQEPHRWKKYNRESSAEQEPRSKKLNRDSSTEENHSRLKKSNRESSTDYESPSKSKKSNRDIPEQEGRSRRLTRDSSAEHDPIVISRPRRITKGASSDQVESTTPEGSDLESKKVDLKGSHSSRGDSSQRVSSSIEFIEFAFFQCNGRKVELFSGRA